MFIRIFELAHVFLRYRLWRLWHTLSPTEEENLGEDLRLACEALGPIFVKFGQVVSTRHDIVPETISRPLSALQDRVTPFDSKLARAEVERGLKRPLDSVFAEFDNTPIAAASVAQVHRARLYSMSGEGVLGAAVAVKILRPHIARTIASDLRLLYALARLAMWLSITARRLRLREVIAEFENHLHDEQNLLVEAGHATALKANFADEKKLLVPRVYWDFSAHNVLTLEWMEGVPVSERNQLVAGGVDVEQLARNGVEIFFTQVFRDGFFHADMHPGNILVALDADKRGRYIALDFGIMGALSEVDRHYLAQNFLAFFARDYRRVAELHIASGWAPVDTPLHPFTAVIRACCEPIFAKPLSQISFANLLMQLFQSCRQFHIVIQPQLVLLQKTMLNVESLGRKLHPDLDLWECAQPVLKKYAHSRRYWQQLGRHLATTAIHYPKYLIELPGLIHRALQPTPLPQRDRLRFVSQLGTGLALGLGGGLALGLLKSVGLF